MFLKTNSWQAVREGRILFASESSLDLIQGVLFLLLQLQ